MMTMAHNDVTGDELRSKKQTKNYEDNYDKIFKRKKRLAQESDDYENDDYNLIKKYERMIEDD